MKNLWTPWCMEYILDKPGKTVGCLFEAAADQPYDRKQLILFRDRLTVILLNRFPYANGHLLVAPARHVADLADFQKNEAQDLMEMIRAASAILRRHPRPGGFNIGLNQGAATGARLGRTPAFSSDSTLAGRS